MYKRQSFTRYPGDRVELIVNLDNRSGAAIDRAATSISCERGAWKIDLGPVAIDEAITVEQRLPRHEPCEGYQIDLLEAYW